MIKVGDYLWHPKIGHLLVIEKIFEQETKEYAGSTRRPWFSYYVIKGMIGDEFISSPFFQGTKKHTGWDYNNFLLTGGEWLYLTKEQLNSPSIKILYGT